MDLENAQAEPETTGPATEELDLRQELAAAYKQHTAEPPAPKPAPEAAPRSEVSSPKPAADTRARDESGKFVKAEAKPAETAPAAAKPAENAPAPAPAAKQYKAPQAWSAQAKAEFDKLPDTVKEYVTQREESIHRAMTQDNAERQFAKQIREVVTPYMPIITAEGGNPVTAVQSLLNTAYQLRTSTPEAKAQLFARLAQQYGVDLRNISTAQAQSPNPQLDALQREIADLKAQRQAEITARQQSETQSLAQELDAFVKAPGHEHYEAVRGHMAALMSSGVASSLQDAYDQACWAHPTIRSTLEAQTLAKRQEEAAAAAAAARNAGGSVRGAPGSGASSARPPERSLRDELAANLRAATGRA